MAMLIREIRQHGLTFTTVEMDFADRSEAKIWILKNQLGRRNLIAPVRIKLALLVESEIAQKAKENSLANLKRNTESDICPTRTTTADLPKEDILPKQDWRAKRETSTNNQLAQMAGVSDKTVQRYKKILQDAPAEVVAQVDTGEISINEGYKQTKQAERKEKIQQQVDEIDRRALEQPAGLFDVIVIDPPWRYGDEHL